MFLKGHAYRINTVVTQETKYIEVANLKVLSSNLICQDETYLSNTKLRCSSYIVTRLYILSSGLLSQLNLIGLNMLITASMKERTNRSSAGQQMTVLLWNPQLLWRIRKDATRVIGPGPDKYM